MNTCPSCRWSRSHGILSTNRKDWRCYQPDVNRFRPSFLAGDPQAAVRCVAERSNVVGVCGTKGRKWEARVIAPPKTMLEEMWESADVEESVAVSGDASGGEPVRVDPASGAGTSDSAEDAQRLEQGAQGGAEASS